MPAKLRSSKKGLISIKNNDQKCFLWFHVRYISPVKIRPETITQEEKKLVNSLNHNGIKFTVRGKSFSKIKKKNNICINVFYHGNKLTFPIYVSDQKLENSTDLLLVIYENKSH